MMGGSGTMGLDAAAPMAGAAPVPIPTPNPIMQPQPQAPMPAAPVAPQPPQQSLMQRFGAGVGMPMSNDQNEQMRQKIAQMTTAKAAPGGTPQMQQAQFGQPGQGNQLGAYLAQLLGKSNGTV